MSIVSLNRRIPLAFITPLTPSGIRYAHSATPMGFVAANSSLRDDCPASSEVSATNTRPSSLIDSTSAGTTFCRDAGQPVSTMEPEKRHTKRLDRHISPIKLLLCAIRADSLMDIDARPLLSTSGSEPISRAKSRICPRSLHRRTGSKIELAQVTSSPLQRTYSLAASSSTQCRC